MKRRKDETFEAYKKRRELADAGIRTKLHPKTLWPSARLGTFRKNGQMDTKYLEKAHRGHFPGGSVESSGDTEGRVDKAGLGGDGGDK